VWRVKVVENLRKVPDGYRCHSNTGVPFPIYVG
jgi:hypothetical protein